MDELINDKIKNILSDPDSLKSILSLASSLGINANSHNSKTDMALDADEDLKNEDDHRKEDSFKPSGLNADVQTPVSALLPMPNIPKSDARVNLLMSIKPFLSDKKKQRVDSLVKALGAAKLISAYKDTDIFSKLGL